VIVAGGEHYGTVEALVRIVRVGATFQQQFNNVVMAVLRGFNRGVKRQWSRACMSAPSAMSALVFFKVTGL